MKVDLGTVEVSDEVRRALRRHVGEPGMATREDVRQFYRAHAESVLDDVMSEYRTACSGGQEARP